MKKFAFLKCTKSAAILVMIWYGASQYVVNFYAPEEALFHAGVN